MNLSAQAIKYFIFGASVEQRLAINDDVPSYFSKLGAGRVPM